MKSVQAQVLQVSRHWKCSRLEEVLLRRRVLGRVKLEMG